MPSPAVITRITLPTGCDCGILFSTYDLLISSTRPSKAEAAAIKVQCLVDDLSI